MINACLRGRSNSGLLICAATAMLSCIGAAKIAFCTDYTATNGASYGGRRVGLKLPNPFGLYDMLGNADEMCLDAYVMDLGTAEVTDPITSVPESSSSRVRRGVNVNGSVANLRGTYRAKLAAASSADLKIGYRLSCPVALKYPAEAAE